MLIAPLLIALTGCFPRYTELPPLAPADLWSPLPRKTALVDDVAISYADAGGPGVPLLFVHGLSSYAAYWEYQLPHYAERYRVIAVDLPGYGASDRPDAPYTPPWFADVLVGFMDTLDLPSATVVGHSMGGQIALTLALDHPERVDRLVLSAPAGFERFSDGEARLIEAYWTEDRALHSREDEVRASFQAAVFNRRDDGVERLIEERVRLGRHPTFRGTSVAVSRSISGMMRYPVLDRLDQITAPTLIVFGTDDRMIPNPLLHGGRTRAIAEAGAAAIPGAELVMLPGAGHTAHHDAPDAFHAAVDDFLQRTRTPTW
jgi:pimeloyl-ACP methyl ester carboxylesterase